MDQSESEEEGLARERTNQKAAFGEEEGLARERTNQRAAFSEEERGPTREQHYPTPINHPMTIRLKLETQLSKWTWKHKFSYSV